MEQHPGEALVLLRRAAGASADELPCGSTTLAPGDRVVLIARGRDVGVAGLFFGGE